jgi:hypothetical protein
VLTNPGLDPVYENAASWNASQKLHGEPGGKNVFVDNNDEKTAAATFTLSQNYPNPFNSSTVISYSLPVESHVRLKVFDMLGREIVTLVNERSAAGHHSCQWDALNISSGVYFYQLRTNTGFVQTQKLFLLK